DSTVGEGGPDGNGSPLTIGGLAASAAATSGLFSVSATKARVLSTGTGYSVRKTKRALPKASSSPLFKARGALIRGPKLASAVALTKTPLAEPRSRTNQRPSGSRYSSPC